MWYEDFLESIITSSDSPIYQYQKLLEKLSQYFPDSLFHKVITKTFLDEDQQKLLEAQLLRENQIGNLSNDKKESSIITFLQKQLHQLERLALKSSKLSPTEKEEIMKEVRELKK